MQGLAYLGDKVSVPIFTQGLWNDNKDIRQGAARDWRAPPIPRSLAELQKAQLCGKRRRPQTGRRIRPGGSGQG